MSGTDRPSWNGPVLRTMGSGTYFGEVAVLTGRVRTSWIMAKTYVICSILHKRLLDEINEKYPGSFVILVKSMKEVCKLTPSITWDAICIRLGEEFDDSE